MLFEMVRVVRCCVAVVVCCVLCAVCCVLRGICVVGAGVLGAWDFHFGAGTRREFPCPRGTRLVINSTGKGKAEKIKNAVTLEDIKRHDWNHCRIVAKGNFFQLWINNKLASEFTDNIRKGQLEKGFIGLQLHDKGMVVEFKDIYLKTL